jgi:sugar phosphate isomerase/epimerase
MAVMHNLRSRRDFLKIGTAAALGAAVSTPNLLAEKGKDAFGGFTLGAQSYTFRHFNLEQALQRMKDLGLHAAEFYQGHVPLTDDPKKISALLKLCKDYEVTPLAWGVQHFSKNTDENKKIFEFGKALGIKAFSASPDKDAFDSLDKLCEEYQIAIAIHPHGPVGGGKLDQWYSAEIIHDAVKDHYKLIGSCLDTGHLIRSAQLGKKLDPVQQIHVMGDRNFGIHLKDNDNKRDTNVVFGQGVLDVPGILKALREVKFKGMISIEYEAKEDNPSPDVKACIEVFKESVKKIA